MAKNNIIPQILQEQKGKIFKNSCCVGCGLEPWEILLKIKDDEIICKICYQAKFKVTTDRIRLSNK